MRAISRRVAGAGSALACAAVATHALGHSKSVCDAAVDVGGVGNSRKPASVEIHCSPISPSCARYKAFFAWQKVPTKVVDTVPLGNYDSQRIVSDGAEVADLKGLVAELRASSGAAGASAAGKALSAAEEEFWVKWVDDKLIPHVFINVFRTPGEAKQAMDTAVRRGENNIVYAMFLRHLGSYYMYASAKMTKRKMEITNVLTGDRIKLIELCDAWVEAVGSRSLLGGHEPNMADLAVYGALSSMEGVDTFKEVVSQSKISGWYERVSQFMKK